MFFSQVYKDFSYASFHFYYFILSTDQAHISLNRVMQGSASLALEHKCMGLFTSSFVLF